MARFSDVFTESNAPKDNRPLVKKIKNIHYTKLVQSQFQYRTRTAQVVEAQADLIKADGKILEPLVVRKAGPGSDTYEIISGHKRCLACKYLVEQEHMEEFAFVPCIVEELSDVRAEFATYSTNGYDEKTPYEIMREIEGMARLLKEHPEEFPEYAGKGRLVEKLAAKMHMSRSVVSDYQNISHNLGEAGMESFKEGKLDKSAAVTLASIPKQKQEEILQKGLTKREEIKSYVNEQTSEPTRRVVWEFFYNHAQNYLFGKEPSEWEEILRYHFKNAGHHGGNLNYVGSYRGIKINSYNEITWNRLCKLMLEYLPKAAYQDTKKEFTPKESGKVADEAEEPSEVEEQIPGQDSVMNHPEWMPAEENVPTVGTTESEDDVEPENEESTAEEESAWHQIQLPTSLVVKVCDLAKEKEKTLSDIVCEILEMYFKEKEL